MSSRRLRLLQIFNRYLQYGGEESVVGQMGAALRQAHDLDEYHYASSQLSGGKLAMAWKTFHNAEVERELQRRQATGKYEAWEIHNIFPAMSPVVYELALKWNVPIVHYLHSYRLSCVNGFFINHGQPCQRCLSGNFWPAFETACWHDSRLQSGWMGLITHRIRKLPLFERVFRWVAISEAQKAEHVRMGIPAERIHVIHHFLEPTRPALPPATRPTALFVGRLSTEKGVGRLLEAWREVAGGERRLIILGDGPERAQLEEQARGIPGVEFAGFVKREEQVRYWQEALFSVVPSMWLEPFGMTVLEAWMNGRAVVGHAIGALPELIRPGVDGELADPDDVNDLARKLEAMLTDPERTLAMGVAGRERLESHFTRARWLAQMTGVYDELLNTLDSPVRK